MIEINGVAAAGPVHVIRKILLLQPIVGAVVEAAQAHRRPVFVAFDGVVEHDVENDFEPCLVQRAHHRLEFGHRIFDSVTAGPVQTTRASCNPSSW